MSDKNDRDDRLELEGTVMETNKGIFKVKVNAEHMVVCRLSGKMKLNEIKVVVGDKVAIEVSPYDVSLGRIVKRLKH